MLQLVGSLAFGLFVAAFMVGAPIRTITAAAVCVGGIGMALLLSVTRSSQLALMISAMTSVLLGASHKVILICVVSAIPVSALGIFYLQNQRQVGFFDNKDGSIMWRQMMWRDGYRLLTESPRHMIVGVGMDSIKNRWLEWGLFDKGHQPMGHFHSTPMQLAVERGIPALIIWLVVLGIYARMLWRGLRSHQGSDWRSIGILLGCAGGLIGFFASGIVHSNLVDQEVAMIFYLMMALGVSLSTMPTAEDVLRKDASILQPS
jgi:O-antigen ligase